MASNFAFVTLLSSDSYLPGALAQVAAINDLHKPSSAPPEPSFQTVCLVTPESVDVSSIKQLRNAFDIVVGVEILEQQNEEGLKLLGRPDLTTVLTKLHVFRLTQFDKIIFLDADVLPIRPISHLFSLPHEFSAAPDVGWPDIFNSGVLVLNPGEDKFAELNHLLNTKPSWDGGDQGLLNEWRGNNWNRLSFTYNTTPTAAYTYAPAYERYGSQISAIHFIGPNKPWKSIPYRAPFAQKQSSPEDTSQRAYHYDALVDRWYDVYDRHYRAHTPPPKPSFEVKHYDAVWDAKASAQPPPSQVFSLDKLRELALQGTTKVSDAPEVRHTVGEYRTMPLEGRIDLMRPRKQEEDHNKSTSQPKPLPSNILIPEELRELPSDSFSYEDTPSTPRNLVYSYYDPDGPIWYTLPTPGPNELPDSPHISLVPLPPTPTPLFHFPKTSPDFYASESESESLLLVPPHDPAYPYHHNSDVHYEDPRRQNYHQYKQQQHQQRPDDQQRQGRQTGYFPAQHYDEPQQKQGLHQTPNYRTQQLGQQQQETRRPMSPPLLSWNPAVEPPPNTTPTPNAFPADTYFANAWDSTPSRHVDHSQKRPSPPESAGLFEPLPPPGIPDSLIKQGHYRNVTGEGNLGWTPSPDRNKVKSVFPWEEKPRNLPGRVFPDSDAPPPSLFLSPSSQSQTSTTTVPSTPETRLSAFSKQAPLSPLSGLPAALTFKNAWDHVPSIQKYATKLARPPPSSQTTLAPPFDDSGIKKSKRSKGDKSEASSRDGDDEDNADDEDEGEAFAKSATEDDDSDRETMRRRSRAGSIASVSIPSKSKKKEYRHRGVQTLTVEKMSFGVQVDPPPPPKPERHAKRHSLSSSNGGGSGGKKQWATTTGSNLLAPAVTKEAQRQKIKSPSISPVPKSPMKSPREFIAPPSKTSKQSATHQQRPTIRTWNTSPASAPATVRTSPNKVVRQFSNDSSLASPSSSMTLPSPLDTNVASAARRGGRVWDPARGVELFKKGSEEVLARFLRMGSFDEETPSH